MEKIKLPAEFFNELKANLNRYLPNASYQNILKKLRAKYGEEVTKKIEKLLIKNGLTAADVMAKFDGIFTPMDLMAVSFTPEQEAERILAQLERKE